jgi:hypothetical protein
MQSRDIGLFTLFTLKWVPIGYPSWVMGYSQEPKTYNGLENWTQNPRWVGLGSGWVRVLMGPAEV